MSTINCKLFTFLTFTCLGLLAVPSGAQASISVSQSVDRTEMAFEDTLNFEISVSWDGPAHGYRFDKPFRVVSDRMTVARFSSTVRSTGSGSDERTTKFFQYQLQPHLSGTATIEPLSIEYIHWPDSVTGMLVTDPVSVTVRQPRPQVAADEGGLDYAWWAVILIVLLGGGIGAYSILKKKSGVERILSPRERFLTELSEIKQDSGSDLKKFQTGFYHSLTMYVGCRYNLNTENQKAEEIVSELNKVEPDQAVSKTLTEWLLRAEKEKYAPLASAPGEVTRLASEVKQFFDKLK